jgi:hypothetical protein
MRYVALLFLMIFLTALVMKKVNKNKLDFTEYLYFSFLIYFTISLISLIVFLFIKFW